MNRRNFLSAAVALAAAPMSRPEIPYYSSGSIPIDMTAGSTFFAKAGESWSVSSSMSLYTGPITIETLRKAKATIDKIKIERIDPYPLNKEALIHFDQPLGKCPEEGNCPICWAISGDKRWA